jgi:hypothetical protein
MNAAVVQKAAAKPMSLIMGRVGLGMERIFGQGDWCPEARFATPSVRLTEWLWFRKPLARTSYAGNAAFRFAQTGLFRPTCPKPGIAV